VKEPTTHAAAGFQPPKFFTDAHTGLPSFALPGTRASRTARASREARSTCAHVMPVSGTFRRRLQGVFFCPAYVPMSM
jgi:hypothetical protein